MTAPDAPERALWRCESCGHIFTEWPIPGVSVGDDGHAVVVPHPYTGEPEQELCGEVVKYTPAPRDDTAELVEALRLMLVQADGVLYCELCKVPQGEPHTKWCRVPGARAALAKWKAKP